VSEEGTDEVRMLDGTTVGWISEAGDSRPTTVSPVDDSLRAMDALARIESGNTLLWTGDYHNGRQLLRAMERRIRTRSDGVERAPGVRWREERRQTSRRATLLAKVVVHVDADGALNLRRAPDTRQAVVWAWGRGTQGRLVSLRTLIGALGSAGWRRRGLEVAGLEGSLTPHYGVFSPTRQAYVSLLDELGDPSGRTALDVGCGTGILSFVLLQRGLVSATGTDVEPRAISCAQDNATRLGLEDRFHAVVADLFVEDQFDWVIFNAPWMPEAPATRLDRAIFDPGGTTLERWIVGVSQYLRPRGQAVLIVSDLPERLELRDPATLGQLFSTAGLQVVREASRPAGHGRARDPLDALHVVRASERIRLFVLESAKGVD
jgi:SAM-dependent methyltransferase